VFSEKWSARWLLSVTSLVVMPSSAPLSKTLAATATASVWLLAMLALKIAIQRLMPAPVVDDYPDSN
jgi:hypothetical protein